MNSKTLASCLCLGTVLIAMIIAGACTQPLSLAQDTGAPKQREPLREALNDAANPLMIAYDEGEESAEMLIAGGYERLANRAAGRSSEAWDTIQKLLGPIRREQNVHMGATVFLHERLTPSGQHLLIHAEYRPNYSFSGRGELEIQVLEVDMAAEALIDMGRHVYDDFQLFYMNTRPVQQMLPHPKKHKLRIYNGQPDANNASMFSFKFEIDGRIGEMTVQILEPAESSEAPRVPRLKVTGRNGAAVPHVAHWLLKEGSTDSWRPNLILGDIRV